MRANLADIEQGDGRGSSLILVNAACENFIQDFGREETNWGTKCLVKTPLGFQSGLPLLDMANVFPSSLILVCMSLMSW